MLIIAIILAEFRCIALGTLDSPFVIVPDDVIGNRRTESLWLGPTAEFNLLATWPGSQALNAFVGQWQPHDSRKLSPRLITCFACGQILATRWLRDHDFEYRAPVGYGQAFSQVFAAATTTSTVFFFSLPNLLRAVAVKAKTARLSRFSRN